MFYRKYWKLLKLTFFTVFSNESWIALTTITIFKINQIRVNFIFFSIYGWTEETVTSVNQVKQIVDVIINVYLGHQFDGKKL